MNREKGLPLEGITVIELGHTVMGPACGMVLADLGAEVIKVEPTGKGDRTRCLKGFGYGFFTCFNRNKKSISVDLKSEPGREVVLKLLEKADVLVENFGPGTIDRLGLGYEICRQRNIRLIYCSLKGFMPGPYERRAALDETVQMMGGLAHMTGPAGRPLRAGAAITDITAGGFGVIGILAALYQRQFSGKGQLIQASLFESAAFLVAQHLAVAAISGEPPPPMPERGRAWSIYDLFSTADGQQVFIGITSERHWQRMCHTFGFKDWLENEKLATNQDRIVAREYLLPELQRRLASLSKHELIALAEKAAIPFAPVNTPQDLLEDPHMNQSNGFVLTRKPDGGTLKLPKIPLRMDQTDFDLRSHPPQVGEGALDILRWVGYSNRQIRLMVEQGHITLSKSEGQKTTSNGESTEGTQRGKMP